MHVFVTGGTGTIGTAVVAELLGNGHTVLALARSDRSEQTLKRCRCRGAARRVGGHRRPAVGSLPVRRRD